MLHVLGGSVAASQLPRSHCNTASNDIIQKAYVSLASVCVSDILRVFRIMERFLLDARFLAGPSGERLPIEC